MGTMPHRRGLSEVETTRKRRFASACRSPWKSLCASSNWFRVPFSLLRWWWWCSWDEGGKEERGPGGGGEGGEGGGGGGEGRGWFSGRGTQRDRGRERRFEGMSAGVNAQLWPPVAKQQGARVGSQSVLRCEFAAGVWVWVERLGWV